MFIKTFAVTFVALVFACGAGAQSAATGSLLVLNKADNTMAIISLSTLRVVATVPTGKGPHEMTVSADGKLAFVANYGAQTHEHSLSVIDIAARKEIRRVELGPLLRPHGIEEKDGKVYFISELTRTVGRYDFAADRIDWIAGTGQEGGHMLVLAPDGRNIYTANRISNTVSAVAVDTGTLSAPGRIVHITTGKRPEGIDISPDGKEVWAGNTGDGTITIIDAASNTIKQQFPVGKVPIRIKFTPDGKKVLVSDSGAEELIVLEAATRKVIKRVKAAASPVGILITPDGKKAFVARSGSGIVSVFDLDKLAFTGDIKTGNAPDGMGWVR
ncbi:MAG: beta-propeller fold lactonase family protein [Chitinophagaceae bacterium]|nr:beta-propeller fold lactonase family protein [Chitinophagaceae bacterium]